MGLNRVDWGNTNRVEYIGFPVFVGCSLYFPDLSCIPVLLRI